MRKGDWVSTKDDEVNGIIESIKREYAFLKINGRKELVCVKIKDLKKFGD